MAHRQRSRRRRTWKNLNRSVYIPSTSPSPPTVIIKRYVTCSVQTDNERTVSQSKKKPFVFHELESVNRITNLPIVESGWNYAGNIYSKIKGSNSLFYWTLDQAESSFQVAVEVATPAIVLFKGPISSIDKLVCKSLDIVEHNVPSINLPPEMIYWNTKKYVTDVSTKIARPVLKRADSVKQIGNTVLASKYTVFAAKSLDEALDVADKYVDKYLPGYDDQTVDEVDTPIDGPTGKAIHTIHHADRFSRKLTRRLTQRTIAEVKALKHHSAEAVHVLTYVAELIATDPVLAYQKGKELWASLSKNEPENQARPENLEQLIVLLMRESARRVVHLINYSSTVVSKVPRNVSYSVTNMVRKILNVADSMVKKVHLEGVQRSLGTTLKKQARQYMILLKDLNVYLGEYLEQLADNLATQETPKSALSVPQINIQQSRATLRNAKKNSNGVENSS
ncbi:lipid storage droplets surface-binding protein 1 isoform X1 [Anoplophora glabripennis]|uniref:lipid storage droplets surface-binding protein 1 isoform X1 n=1 Tax=Anoplophora glabripennis TaxID=217634 RepID=UPI000874075C|nr:lipid storage droplets surface-binding protein 1 isoform X1 [Anoplophora glabripennis]XP_018562338.1 lipid storage droplets surface-binding protein 1 isoform X1 [Anoplophora glabripennis]XP_018562339.1 lipid storage droplets surface-binding protein 1 isoform X1 [Anoplophora glabripennis]XP_018562340.1 lipid storage droplets surface-binding protein 1 isoform X1 [Anoplophora glabripennis]